MCKKEGVRANLNNLNELAKETLGCFVANSIEESDKAKLVKLVEDLLGDRKNWFWGLKSRAVLPEEVANGILGHVYTESNGYFKENELVSFDENRKLVTLMSKIT